MPHYPDSVAQVLIARAKARAEKAKRISWWHSVRQRLFSKRTATKPLAAANQEAWYEYHNPALGVTELTAGELGTARQR